MKGSKKSVIYMNCSFMSFLVDNKAPTLLKEHAKNALACVWGVSLFFFLIVHLDKNGT